MGAIRKKQRWSLVLGVAIVALIAVGAAYAITSSSFTYSKAKTGYFVVGPLAFHPGADGRIWTSDGNNGLTTNGGCFIASVNLPAGAKVKSAQVFFRSVVGAFALELWRTKPSAGNGAMIADKISLDTSGNLMSMTASVPSAKQAVSPDYAYALRICEGNGDHLYGAKVKYTYTSAGS
jgi:hypothetical protein